MKKKEDVYVVVDSRKKAIELEGVLKMFGEVTFNYDSIYQCLQIDGFLVFSEYYGSWFAASSNENRTQVSIQELKNILAREYLKEGNFIVVEDKGMTLVGPYSHYEDQFRDFVLSKRLSNGKIINGVYGFHNFVRLATEEEKGLFNNRISDKDVAIIERLHDTLLDNHGYSLDSKLLTDARILANKLKNK